MLKLSVSRIPELLAAIGGARALFLPARSGGQVNFTRWDTGVEYCGEALNTVKSAKDFFFPQSENLLTFQTQGKSISITPGGVPEEPFVIFGARPCDVRAMDILDMVFLSDPQDSFYKARRESGVVVAMACNAPEETCFCGSFGIDAADPPGDVAAWIVGDTLYWDAKTEKGEALTGELSALFSQADGGDLAALKTHKEEIASILERLPLSDLRPQSVGGSLLELFSSEKWGELSQACLGCGACTFVCPTCQCYDIQDFNTGHGVQRFRCWDSCMYSDFTMMAHGNPRTSRLERFRQRFMHKLVYFPENNGGQYSCVGCGRCVSKCPVSLNITKVIKAFGVKENVR